MIINIELGLSGTPIDYTRSIDYPVTESVIVELVDAESLIKLAVDSFEYIYNDNSAILDATISKFYGLTDDIGTVIALPDQYDKPSIIEYLKTQPTIENTIVIRILTQALELLPDGTDDSDVNYTTIYNGINDAIAQKIGAMAALPIGQYFTELLQLDTIQFN